MNQRDGETGISRRALAHGSAWAVPAVVLAGSAPVLAASSSDECVAVPAMVDWSTAQVREDGAVEAVVRASLGDMSVTFTPVGGSLQISDGSVIFTGASSDLDPVGVSVNVGGSTGAASSLSTTVSLLPQGAPGAGVPVGAVANGELSYRPVGVSASEGVFGTVWSRSADNPEGPASVTATVVAVPQREGERPQVASSAWVAEPLEGDPVEVSFSVRILDVMVMPLECFRGDLSSEIR